MTRHSVDRDRDAIQYDATMSGIWNIQGVAGACTFYGCTIVDTHCVLVCRCCLTATQDMTERHQPSCASWFACEVVAKQKVRCRMLAFT